MTLVNFAGNTTLAITELQKLVGTAVTPTPRTVITSADLPITATDTFILLITANDLMPVIPAQSTRNNLPLTIKNAYGHTQTLTATGADLFDGLVATYVLGLGASVTLIPFATQGLQGYLLEDATLVSPIGYAIAGQGTGGTVTQTTAVNNTVTLNTLCGKITTITFPWSTGAPVQFGVTNNKVLESDVIAINQANGGGAVAAGFLIFAEPYAGGGGFVVTVYPFLTQTVPISMTFAIIRTVTS